MELWQMDIMGGVFLVDGSGLKVVTGLDDHSRFCVSAKVARRATARPVCDALAEAMRAHGIPDQILTDNGKLFTGRFGPGSGEVLFDRICRENGIRHLLTAPRSPTTTGKVERFHKTIKKELLADRLAVTALIGFVGLHHSIAGSVEILMGVFVGSGASWSDYGFFLIWATVGNAIGVVASAILGLIHRAVVFNIKGPSWRLREHQALTTAATDPERR